MEMRGLPRQEREERKKERGSSRTRKKKEGGLSYVSIWNEEFQGCRTVIP